jgi:hypothetical protein
MIHGSFTGEWGCWHGACRSPEAIGLAVISAFAADAAAAAAIAGTAAIGTITYGAIIGQVAITGASLALSYGANKLLSSGAHSTVNPAIGHLNIKQAVPPRTRSYGKVKRGGAVSFEEKDSGADSGPVGHGSGGGTNDLYIELLQGQGEIYSVVEHWLSDEQVLLDVNSKVSNPDSTYNQRIWIKNKLGTKTQTAFSDLVTLFQPDYGVNHRWRGVPVTLLRFGHPVDAASAQKIYPQGVPPYRSVQLSALVHDPRIDTQDPDGDPDNPTSAGWTYSDNAALVILDYRRHPDGFAQRADRSMLPIDRFDVPSWIAFANLCDEPVQRKDGSGPIPRYRLWGTYDLTTDPDAILAGMMRCCDAEFYLVNGKIGIRGGKWNAPTVTITNPFHELKMGQRAYASCNWVNAKYTSPQHDFQQVDMDPFKDQANIDLIRQELRKDFDFTWLPHHSQARRLSKIALNKLNPQWSGKIQTGPDGWRARHQRIITVQIDELGISLPFLLLGFRPSTSLATIEMEISSLDPETYDWDPETEEGDAPAISALSLDDSTLPLPANVVFSSAPTGTPGEEYATVTWQNNSGLTLIPQVQYQDVTIINPPFGFPIAGALVDSAWIDVLVPEDTNSASVIVHNPGAYVFRVRFVSPTGRASKWVETVPEIFGTMSFNFSDKRNSGYIPLL